MRWEPYPASPRTVTFPNATTGEVLVVSGTEFAHAQSIDLAAGAYTVTVGAGESRVVGASGVQVAGSVGGTGWSGSLTNAITGVDATYATPQVILRYNTTFCPASVDSPPFTPTGNVTFLLAKGNVTTADITDTLQSAITTAIATALDITEPDRVSIDTVKPSPRREKEVNMVVHVEHDDTDRNSIASKTADVATAVKTTLNGNNLNVCGCNAASLVNSEIQTSINS